MLFRNKEEHQHVNSSTPSVELQFPDAEDSGKFSGSAVSLGSRFPSVHRGSLLLAALVSPRSHLQSLHESLQGVCVSELIFSHSHFFFVLRGS